MDAIEKERAVAVNFRNGRLDIMGLQETCIKGSGKAKCMTGNECEMWEGLEVWCECKMQRQRSRSMYNPNVS